MIVPIKNSFLKIILIKLFFFLFILQLPVMAADVTIIPSLKLKGEYNDNIYFERTNYVDDYIGHINPALEFGYVSELLDLKANADVDFLYYKDETDLDTETQLYELEGAYQIFERWEILGGGSYRKDTTRDSYLEETGRVIEREDVRNYSASGGLSYEINERSDIDINYNYLKTDFELDSSTDNERHTVALSYNNLLKNNLDIITFQPSYSYRDAYRSRGNLDLDVSEADTYTLAFIWTHPFSETLNLESEIGGRYTEQSYNDERKDQDNWGVVADINLIKTAERYSVLIGYSRDLTTDIEGDEIEVDRISCTLNRGMTERLSFRILGALYFSRLDTQSNNRRDEDRRYYKITPSLYYQITENHNLELIYSYSNENNDNEPGIRDRHRVWLNLTFKFPKKW